MDQASEPRRGCIFYNFGVTHILQLLVSIHSLRRHYKGPITVFVEPADTNRELRVDLKILDADVVEMEGLSRSLDRHRVLRASPYETTLSFDSDLIFLGNIEALWEPLEKKGVLVTQFYPPPYGIDGTRENPGEISRFEHFETVKELLCPDLFERTIERLVSQRIDLNIGVLGICRPRGNGFMEAWEHHMEKGRGQGIPILDELLVCALVNNHPHHLAGEIWNCPADEHFRRTNISDAKVIHYFADGHCISGVHRMGRNYNTWAGRKWYQAYVEATATLDLERWKMLDDLFDDRAEQTPQNRAGNELGTAFKDLELGIRRIRNMALRRPPPVRNH